MKSLRFISSILFTILIVSGNLNGRDKKPVIKEILGDHNGSEVSLFILTNKSGNVLKLTNYGARFVESMFRIKTE